MLVSIYENFDRFCVIDFSILSVNCSHVCIIYVKIYEKILSGGLEVSFSIEPPPLTHLPLDVWIIIGKRFRYET